jgi:serine O-acetyltransferase
MFGNRNIAPEWRTGLMHAGCRLKYTRAMWRTIDSDIKSSARSRGKFWRLRALFLSPGLSAVLLFRLQDGLYRMKLLLPAYLVHRVNLNVHGIDILPGAVIGDGLRIDHPVGIVIGAGVKIGSGCILLQNVTIGTRYVNSTGYDNEFPLIGNNVTVGAGAVILGGVKIGDDCTVGANSVVLADVRDGTTVTGVHTGELG